jgi:dual specificity phosphatase 12
MEHMNEVIPKLWIGDIQSAFNVEELRRNNIRSILSAMRGRMTIHPVSIHEMNCPL